MSHDYGKLSESSDSEQTEVEMSRVGGESEAESDPSTIDESPVLPLLDKTAADERSRAERTRIRVCEALRFLRDRVHTHVTTWTARVLECEVKLVFAVLFAAFILFPLVLTLVDARIEDGVARLHAQQRHDAAAKDAVIAALRGEMAELQQKVHDMRGAFDALAANNATLAAVSGDSARHGTDIAELQHTFQKTSEAANAQRVMSEANKKLADANSATLAAVSGDSARHGTDIAELQHTFRKTSEAANAQRVMSEANKKLADANTDTLASVSASLATLRYTITNKGCRLQSTGLSDWVNEYDKLVDFKCGYDSVITGVYSKHDNDREDRRFRYQCSTLVCY